MIDKELIILPPMIFRSIRWRIQGIHLIALLLVLLIMGTFGDYLIRTHLLEKTDKYLNKFSTQISLPLKDRPKIAEPFWFRVTSRDNTLLFASDNAPNLIPPISDHGEVNNKWVQRHRVCYIQREQNGPVIVVGIGKPDLYQKLISLRYRLAGATFILSVIALAIGWWTIRKALSPIQQFTETVRDISKSTRFEAIDLSDTQDELKELGLVLNETFQRLHHSLDLQKNLTADASHELRTPISIILLELESALRKERSSEEYQERITSGLEATHHLKQLVETLLILARSDTSGLQLNQRPTAVDTLVSDVVDFLSPKAQETGAQLIAEIYPMTSNLDSERMRQVFINLINNSLQHGGADITVTVKISQDSETTTIQVHDTGYGIPEHALPHVFDRFYRQDRSRNTSLGNLGLGLTICQTVVEAHGGSITVVSSTGRGTSFSIHLPHSTCGVSD